MNKLFFFSDYIKNKYGKKLYRIAFDFPFSCPHREKNSGRGCTFCPEDGARARHLRNHLDLNEQFKKGVQFAKERYKASSPYIAYFQSFTNTNADLRTLRNFYSEALSKGDFKVLCIATRPDCLSDNVIEYLQELNQKYELWIELGVQTSNNKTLKRVGRGHDFSSVENAVQRLDDAGINTAAHVILGLPGENRKDFLRTAEELASLPFKSVKIHNLLVLKNTPLASEYAQNPFKVLNEYEYAEELKYFLQNLPSSWSIMRLTADAAEKDVIAPNWLMSKGQFIDHMKKIMDNKNPHIIETDDGSKTFFHPAYRQLFHSQAGAETEAVKKFIEPSGIRNYFSEGRTVKLLDVGFGLGYNSFAAVSESEKYRKSELEITALEENSEVLAYSGLIFAENSFQKNILQKLSEKGSWKSENASIKIHFDDARNSVKKINDDFDLIWLDAFSVNVNTELWTVEFIRELCINLKKSGALITYSASFAVKSAMIECGLFLGTTKAFGRKKPGTIASFSQNKIKQPLSAKEMKIISDSTAGVPYRDPNLNFSAEKIRKVRKREVQNLRKQGVPKWIKL